MEVKICSIDGNHILNIFLKSVVGIYAQLDVISKYPFTKIEKDVILAVNELVKSKKIGKYEVYKYGLYNSSIASEILGINKKNIVKIDRTLPIKTKKDIKITTNEICKILDHSWLLEVIVGNFPERAAENNKKAYNLGIELAKKVMEQ